MAASEKLKSCGWCHDKAIEHDDGTGVGVGLYHCVNRDCPLNTVGFDEEEWNRRALTPRSVEGWMREADLTRLRVGEDTKDNIGAKQGPWTWFKDDIRVLIVPVEEGRP